MFRTPLFFLGDFKDEMMDDVRDWVFVLVLDVSRVIASGLGFSDLLLAR
jgi:hypothetical protein